MLSPTSLSRGELVHSHCAARHLWRLHVVKASSPPKYLFVKIKTIQTYSMPLKHEGEFVACHYGEFVFRTRPSRDTHPCEKNLPCDQTFPTPQQPQVQKHKFFWLVKRKIKISPAEEWRHSIVLQAPWPRQRRLRLPLKGPKAPSFCGLEPS